MPSLTQKLETRTELGPEERAWLVRLVDEWSLLADLSFSDLILWVTGANGDIFLAVAQERPTTGPTSFEDDVVGTEITYDPEHLVTKAYLSHKACQTSPKQLGAGIPVETTAIPIMMADRCIGVVELHTNRIGFRTPGALEDAYLNAAKVLQGMVLRREFPSGKPDYVRWLSPRVGDGLIRVGSKGTIKYASPNALSAYRRMGLTGDLIGEKFVTITKTLLARHREPVEEPLATALRGRGGHEVDLESRQATVRVRVIPLKKKSGYAGLLVICRDTTELRSKERQLLTKDATIRESHHRVKNNLQTVAALLRLQARRIKSAEAKNALEDAIKRVQSIAVVHDILAREFDQAVKFDDIADRLLKIVGNVSTTSGRVEVIRDGSFGLVPADVAANLSLVLTELCQNAIEHGFRSGPGDVVIYPSQHDGLLTVQVFNGGEPFPDHLAGENANSLGLSIVRALVENLNGTFDIEPVPEKKGTLATVTVPLS